MYSSDKQYAVVNAMGRVYTGMMKGVFQWSDDWSMAKPLHLESTSYLLTDGIELIPYEETQ